MSTLPTYFPGSVVEPGWNGPGVSTETKIQNMGQDYSTGVWGQTIPLTQGSRALVGAPIWSSDTVLTTRGQTESFFNSQGGTTSSGSVFSSSNVAVRSFAMAYGYNLAPDDEHAVPKVQRLWFGSELVYDARDESVVSPLYNKVDFQFYTGTQTQLPDAFMEQFLGTLTPAYRGMMYIVFRNVELASFDVTPFSNSYTQPELAQNFNDMAFNLPVVRAEIVDGQTTVGTVSQFQIVDQVHTPSFSNMHADWAKRLVVQVSQTVANKPTILTYDVDSQVQISSQLITGSVDGAPLTSELGFSGRFSEWDLKNDVLYTTPYGLLNNVPIISIDRKTGVIKGQCGNISQGTTFGPRDVDGNDPFVTGKDAIIWPNWRDGDVGYYNDGDGVKPLVCGAAGVFASTGVFVSIAPNPDGTWPVPTAPVAGMHDFGEATHQVYCLPLTDPINGLAPSQAVQDVCALVCHGFKVSAVYLTVSANRSRIYEIRDIIDFTASNEKPYAVALDKALNLNIVTQNAVSLHNFLTRIQTQIVQENSSFFQGGLASTSTRVPGFRGYCPVWPAGQGIMYQSRPIPDIGGDQEALWHGMKGGDFSQYEGGGFTTGATKINLMDASTTTNVAAGSPAVDNYSWDEPHQGLVAQRNAQVFFYPVKAHLNFSQALIGDYLRWLSLKAGYLAVNVTVDPQLTDPVLGAMLMEPFVFFDLFSELGALYGFTFFESSGKIKFLKTARNPVRATGDLQFTGNPVDGDTATIGAQVYVFKNALSLPFHVKIGAALVNTRDSLVKAVNLTGVVGTDYGAGTTINASVTAAANGADKLTATAIHGGLDGNAIAVAETSANLSWVGGITHLAGGLDSLAAELTLTPDNMCELGLVTDVNEVLLTTVREPSASVSSVQMNYYDFNQDYTVQPASYFADGQTGSVGGLRSAEMQMAVPFVFTEAEAQQRVQKVGFKAAVNDVVQEFRLPVQFILAEPVDVASITIAPYNYLVKIDEIIINADWTMSCSGLNYASRDDVPLPAMVNRQADVTVKTTGDGVPVVFDMPTPTPLTPDVGGRFAVFDAMRSLGQPGFTVATVSLDDPMTGNHSLLFVVDKPVPYGVTASTPPTTSTPWAVDEATGLLVACKTMSSTSFLSASTTEDFLAGKNALVVGKPGRWELIYFRDVTVLSPTLVQLNGLVRGMRGTEGNTDTHQAADEVYLVASLAAGFSITGYLEQRAVADIGTTQQYQSQGSPGLTTGTLDATFVGYSLYPFAPWNVHVVLGGGNDLAVTWVRRDRKSVEDWVTGTVAMSEATESYKLEIMSGASVVRTITGLTTPSYTYTSASQAADGFTPPLTALKLRVYQVGVLGPGFTKEQTVNVE